MTESDSDHFPPPPRLLWSKPPSSFTWIIEKPPNWSLCLHSCPPHPHSVLNPAPRNPCKRQVAPCHSSRVHLGTTPRSPRGCVWARGHLCVPCYPRCSLGPARAGLFLAGLFLDCALHGSTQGPRAFAPPLPAGFCLLAATLAILLGLFINVVLAVSCSLIVLY